MHKPVYKPVKCGHGVYLASSEEVSTKQARYCSLCTPEVDHDVLRREDLFKKAENESKPPGQGRKVADRR